MVSWPSSDTSTSSSAAFDARSAPTTRPWRPGEEEIGSDNNNVPSEAASSGMTTAPSATRRSSNRPAPARTILRPKDRDPVVPIIVFEVIGPVAGRRAVPTGTVSSSSFIIVKLRYNIIASSTLLFVQYQQSQQDFNRKKKRRKHRRERLKIKEETGKTMALAIRRDLRERHFRRNKHK